MATTEIIKIAPTLSAEERFKLMLPDMVRAMDGEKMLLSDGEANAIRTCPIAILDDYNYRISLVMWIMMLWIRDWNAEHLRMSSLIVALLYQTELTIRRVDKNDRSIKDPFDTLRSVVAGMSEKMKEFYAYRESIPLLERELYGLPFLSEEMQADMAKDYEDVDRVISFHNDLIREIPKAFKTEKFLKPITEHAEQYLIEKPTPDTGRAEAIAQNLKGIAEADIRRRK